MKFPNIQDYTNRLKSCGFSSPEAARMVCSFLKEFTEKDLQSYIESLEKDLFKYVD